MNEKEQLIPSPSGEATLTLLPHYKVLHIEGTNDERWDWIHQCFPEDKADAANLLMGSTSGMHGSYRTLDDLKREAYEDGEPLECMPEHIEAFTLLVIQPRLCLLHCGTIGIRSHDDIVWLRKLITASVKAFAKSQEGNLDA